MIVDLHKFLVRHPIELFPLALRVVTCICCVPLVAIVCFVAMLLTLPFFVLPSSVTGSGSFTSKGMTMLRATSFLVGACNDSLAYSLLHSHYKVFLFAFVVFGWLFGRYKLMYAGLARTQLGDQAVSDCAKNGFEQIVLLGAGDDTRLHRISGIPTGGLFEVDTPMTQKFKLQDLGKYANKAVHFVPCNFETQSWLVELTKRGFDKSRKTLFLWEGVTYYLTRAAISSTLKQISQCAQGSMVIFDYSDKSSEVKLQRIKKMLQWIGEPFISAFHEADIPVLLEECNLKLIEKPFSLDQYELHFKDPQFFGKIQDQSRARFMWCVKAVVQ